MTAAGPAAKLAEGLPCNVSEEVVDPRAGHEAIFTACRRLLEPVDAAWRALEFADAEVVRVSGGITNLLFRVGPAAAPVGEPARARRVLVRCFGEAGSAVCNRQQENRNFAQLSEAGLGPRMMGVFANGRLEEWLEGRRPLEPLEMLQRHPVDFPALCAARLASLHSSTVGGADGTSAGCRDIWGQLRHWAELGASVAFDQDEAKAAKLRELDPFPRFGEELDWLQNILPSPKNMDGEALLEGLPPAARRARELLYDKRFCHMDLLSGNIMYCEDSKDVRLIDFEYAAWTYCGLDLANHFNAVPESCLIVEDVFDPQRYYPGEVLQLHWLEHYWRACAVEVDELVLQEMLAVIADFALLAELRWVIWGVVQAGSSPVDFDYLGYAAMRYQQGYLQYKRWREYGRDCNGDAKL